MNQAKGFLALLVSGIFYASYVILARWIALSFGNISQTVVRSGVALLILGTWFAYKKLKPVLPRKVSKFKLFIYLITPPLSISSFTQSVMRIKASNVYFFIYAGIFISTFFLGLFLFKEKVSRLKIVSLLLACLGIYLLSYPLQISSLTGAVFAMLAGFFDSLQMSMCKYLGSYRRIFLLFYEYLVGTIVGLFLVFVFKEQMLVGFAPISILAAILIGFFQIGIGYLYLYGFNNFDINLGSIVASSELFFAMLWSAIFLREFPGRLEVLGGFLVFLAVNIISFSLLNIKKLKFKYLGVKQ